MKVTEKSERKADYSIGEHEAWEVALHEWRFHTAILTLADTKREETRWLEEWLTRHRRTAHEVKLCFVCSENIAEALLNKQDPFKCPDTVKQQIKTMKMREWS